MTLPALAWLLLTTCAGDDCLPFEWVPDDACRPGRRAALTVSAPDPGGALPDLTLRATKTAVFVLRDSRAGDRRDARTGHRRDARAVYRIPKPSGTLHARQYGPWLVFLRGERGLEVHDLRRSPPVLTHRYRFGPPVDGARTEGPLLIFTSGGRALCRRPQAEVPISAQPLHRPPDPHAGRLVLEAAVFSGAGLHLPFDESPGVSFPVRARLFVRLPWERHLVGIGLDVEMSRHWGTLLFFGYRHELSEAWFADLLLGLADRIESGPPPDNQRDENWPFLGARLGWVHRFGPLRVGVTVTAGACEELVSLSAQVFLGLRLF